MRATESEEVVKLAIEKQLALSSVLDQVLGLIPTDLLACAKVDANLGLSLFKHEDLEGLKFVHRVWRGCLSWARL